MSKLLGKVKEIQSLSPLANNPVNTAITKATRPNRDPVKEKHIYSACLTITITESANTNAGFIVHSDICQYSHDKTIPGDIFGSYVIARLKTEKWNVCSLVELRNLTYNPRVNS